MPDPEIESLAGDGLDPTAEFTASLRTALLGEWRGERSSSPRRPWRVWAAAAAAVLVVLGVAGLASRRDGTAPVASAPPSTDAPSTVSSSVLPSTVPLSLTEGLPSTVLGRLWVVTSVHGVPLQGPDLPTFTAHADGTISGWDGCNTYALEPGHSGSTAAPCPHGVVAVKAVGPFTMTSGADVTAPTFTAEMFDRQDVEAPPLARQYRFGDLGSLTLFDGGVLAVDGAGCSFGSVGTWTANPFRLDLPRTECAVGDPSAVPNDFRRWLQTATGAGLVYSFHDGPAGGLWTAVDGRVARLVPHATVAADLLGTWAFNDRSGITIRPDGGGSQNVGGCPGGIGYRLDGDVLTLTPGHSALCTAANADPPFQAWLGSMMDTGGSVVVVDDPTEGKVLEVLTRDGQVTRLHALA